MDERMELGEFDLDAFMQQAEAPTESRKIIEKHYRIILAIDASNSMRGHKIGASNDVVNNIISKLKSFAKGQNCEVQVAVIGFSSKLFRWTNGFVPVNDFTFSYVEMVDGKSDINALLDELIRIAPTGGQEQFHNCVVLFTDGLPTEDYAENLSKWRMTSTYRELNRVAVSFDEDLEDPQSREFLEEFADGGSIVSIKDQDVILSQILV